MPAAMNIQPAKRGDAIGLAAHAYRFGAHPDHIDRSRTSLNKILRGPATLREARALIEGLPDRQPPKAKGKAGRKIRTDANYTAQLICTLPEELDESALEDWVAATLAWAEHDAPGRLLYAALHRDEKSPHLHMAIHAVEESEKLNYKALFGRPSPDPDSGAPPVSELTALQESYAARLAAAELKIDPTQGLHYEHTGIDGWRTLKAASAAEARAAAAESRADAAEARLEAAEEALALVEPLIPVNSLAIPAPAPQAQARAIKEKDELRRWGDGETRVQPMPAGSKHVTLPLPWFIRLRHRMLALVDLRTKLQRLVPHIFKPSQDPLHASIDKVAGVNARGNAEADKQATREKVHISPAHAESDKTDAGAENNHMFRDSSDYVPEGDSGSVYDQYDDESDPAPPGPGF